MVLAQSAAKFGALDWLVVAGYLIVTTLIGARLAGKQATIRDFFLGGRKLPWWAISGSIVATEVSAATIVGVPTISYAAGGNLTYLQLALGSVLARIIVARYFVRRFYEHEIYSPYDYAGAMLGPRVKGLTTGLFFVGAVLGQGARLYIAASVLGAVAGIKLVAAMWLMGAFAVGWTLLGGMTTVIWTDVIQFTIVVIGAVFALVMSVGSVQGGLPEVLRLGSEAGKFRLFDFAPDLSLNYGFWCGVMALPFLNLAAFGTDQVMAQRMFCCRTEADARKAILWSNVSLFIPVLMLGVGIALYAYFIHNPMTPSEAASYAEDPKNRLLPVFILRALPVGARGIIVAAIFAAAISSLLGALTALSQATASFLIKKSDLSLDAATGHSRAVLLSKVLVVIWGVVLCGMGMACIEIAKDYKNVIDLALSLVRYTYGPLLGIFLLAFLPRKRDDAGLFWAVGMTICTVLGLSLHDARGDRIVWVGGAFFAGMGMLWFARDPRRMCVVVGGSSLIVLAHYLSPGMDAAGQQRYISTFWHYPIATGMTLAIAYLLGRLQKNKTPAES